MMRNLLVAWIVVSAAFAGSIGNQSVDNQSVPLFFIANGGQAPPAVRFMAQGSGLTAYFLTDEALFRMGEESVRLQFVGAHAGVRVEGAGQLEGRANFLTGSEDAWLVGLPMYRAVAYRDLYPGIDMIYGGNGRHLKSEFVVAPGADPRLIRWRYAGAGEVRLEESGALIIPAGGRNLREEAPAIYQDRGGSRVMVSGQFSVAADGTVGFLVNDYDTSLPLIIDPTLSYSTLLGGSSSDAAMSLAVDSSGSAYVSGFTASYDFPTANPEQNFNAGGNDVFVAKLNAAGNGLDYCTYIGGTGDDRANGMAVDTTGAVYVTGSTTSSNFPLRNALQSKFGGIKDGFVLKLSSAGNSLAFSTYLGGSGADAGNGIAVDGNRNVYVVGDTTSINFPATGLQKGIHGGQDAFIAKLSADGSRLVYSTYLGGTGDDHGAAIALDASGDAYVTGSTWSSDFPVASAAQGHLAGGQDAFIAKLSAGGTSLLFSTFLGGSGGTLGYPEAGQGIAVDSQGNVYVAGVTGSSDFPLLHAVQTARQGWSDAFVAKLSSGGALVYSTYLGGSGVDAGNAIAVDASGKAYIAGQTLSSDLPVLNATQGTRGGSYDAFWAGLSATGDSLLALSYLGGNGADTATAVALDGAGNLYIAGWTQSSNFPVLNGYQSTNAGNYGAFITKIAVSATGPPASVSVTPNSGMGASQTFAFVYSDPRGYGAIRSVQVLVNSTMSTPAGCYLLYYQPSNALYLTNDAGTAWQTPVTLGQSGTLENSQCSADAVNSSASGSGYNLTLNLALSFKPAFAGAKGIYTEVYDGTGDSGWQQRGTWTVPGTGPPVNVSVTPNSGSGTSHTFAFAFSDPQGYTAILSAQMLINGSLAAAGGCYLFYNRAAGIVYLTNDAGTAWQSPVTLGQSGTLENSQCSVDPGNSSASGSGTGLTLNLALSFKAAFAGAKNIYMEVYDGTGDSGWQQRGTWTVPGSGPPATVSVNPASGSGSSQAFSFVFSDPAGYAAILSAQILINNPMSVAGGCYLLYYRPANAIYLTNDAGTSWQTPVTLGQSGTLQNSQCSVNAASSSSGGSGNTLTVTLSLTFKPAFSGARNIYMEVYDGAGDSGWQQRGSWTVP